MRAVYWILVVLLACAAYVIVSDRPTHAVPSGQYSVTERSAFWPSVQAVGLYRPRSMMGDDSLALSSRDAKLACVRSASNWVIQ